jgi:hypothetical protein
MDRITFPTPSADWGQIAGALVPNPRWRWWAFWRPRAIVLRFPEPITIGPGIAVPAMTSAAVAPLTLRSD